MSSEFLDKIFLREFRDMVKQVRGYTTFNVDMLPMPHTGAVIDTGIKVYITGIEDIAYNLLNNLNVTKLEQTVVTRNTYWNSGEIRGTEDFHAGSNRLIIRTDVDLNLPFKYKSTVDPEIEYIDYITSEVNGKPKTYYFYAIPTKYCYSVTNTALVVSEKSKPKHYGGIRLVSSWGYYVYLYIVNVKGLKDIESQKIIKTGINPRELEFLMQQTVDFWVSTGSVFNYKELEVSIPVDNQGNTNLAYSKYEANLEYEERTDTSIEEEKMTAKQLYENGGM